MIGRRGFIGATGAFAAAVSSKAAGKDVATPDIGEERMRFGAISDIHITTSKQQPYFEKALRQLDAWKVDGVLASGDLADFGLEQQLQLLADSWFKVFPDGKGSDGRPVANLMHYGDHDMSQSYWDMEEARKVWPSAEERKRGVIFDGDRKAIWERCFKEPWAPIQIKNVKGYDFILAHFTRGEPTNKYGHNTPGLEEFFTSRKFDPTKPFFYSQHRVPRGTVLGPTAANLDEGKSTALFSRYPNLIAFCGHCHTTAAFEKNIWQGAFTCIQVPSLRYCCTMCGRENGYSTVDRPPIPPYQMMPQHPSGHTHQGLLCIVGTKGALIRRWDFEEGKMLGPDWVVPFASFTQKPEEKPYSNEYRTKTVLPVEFAAGAEKKLKIDFTKGTDRGGNKHDFFTVSFPPAVKGLERADDYEVSVELQKGDVERCLVAKRVYSPRYLYGVASETLPVTCNFSAEEVPPGWLVRFVARPVTAFGVKGKPIATRWEFRAWGKTAKEAAAIAHELNLPPYLKKKAKK